MANNIFTLIRIFNLLISGEREKLVEAARILDSFNDEEIKSLDKFIEKKMLNKIKK